MKSMYASSKPCPQCKAEWKIGEEIFKISDKYWCSNASCPDPRTVPYQPPEQETTAKQETIPQAKDFDEMQTQTLFDDGYSRAKRKIALLRGVRKALPNEDAPVIGMIFNQICADLRL